MLPLGVAPDALSYQCVIYAYQCTKEAERAEKVLDLMQQAASPNPNPNPNLEPNPGASTPIVPVLSMVDAALSMVDAALSMVDAVLSMVVAAGWCDTGG